MDAMHLAGQLKRYRILTLLNTLFNDCIINAHLPIVLGGFGVFVVITFFGTVRFSEQLAPVVFVYFPTLMVELGVTSGVILKTGGMLFQESQKFYLQILGLRFKNIHKNSMAIMRREIFSLRPFGVRIGHVQSIRNHHGLNFYLFCTNVAISSLTLVPLNQI